MRIQRPDQERSRTGHGLHGKAVIPGALLAVACFGACGDGGVKPGSSPGAENGPAVLVAVIVESPADRHVYVGAVPEVPSGPLDYSRFREFGSVDAFTHAGYVFVWEREPARMTRFTVNGDLSLTEGPTIIFAQHGAAGGGEHVFISATRAYLLSPQLDTVVVWNPEAMAITGTIPISVPDRGAGFETFAHKGRVVGDSVVWQVVSANWATNTIHHAATLAVASATADDPVQIVEDTRCAGADGGHVDARGDYYVVADAYWGYFATYGDNAASVGACVLRVPAGQRAFDPGYRVDIRELTGQRVSFPWLHVGGSRYLAQIWDPARSAPIDPTEYWSSDMVPLLVDLDRKTAEAYPAVDGTIMVSSAEHVVDGVAYYELSEKGYVVGGRSDVVELRPEGIVHRFSVPGLWALARIR
jgi:hypothetical protein